MDKKHLLTALSLSLSSKDSPLKGHKISLLTPAGYIIGEFVLSKDDFSSNPDLTVYSACLRTISSIFNTNDNYSESEENCVLMDENSILLKNVTVLTNSTVVNHNALLVFYSDIIGVTIGNIATS